MGANRTFLHPSPPSLILIRAATSAPHQAPSFQLLQQQDQPPRRKRLKTPEPPRMGPVFWRDFAYNKKRFRLRMATGSVGEADAREFARYANDFIIHVSSYMGQKLSSTVQATFRAHD